MCRTFSNSSDCRYELSLSFDIIGLAAFSHEFKSLDGEPSAVSAALTALGHSKPSPNVAKILLLSQAYPFLLKLPLPRSVHIHNLSTAMDAVIEGLVRKSTQKGENPESALGVLCKCGPSFSRQQEY
jgi:hypothetical protein